MQFHEPLQSVYLSRQSTRDATSGIEPYMLQASSIKVINKYNLADISLPNETCGSKLIIIHQCREPTLNRSFFDISWKI